MAVPFGTLVAIDGGVGEITVNPTAEESELLAERKRRRAAALAGGTGNGATKDGYPVALLANIGTAEDARKAAKQPVEGVGLFRTEFLFLDRDTMPTVEEQTATYTEVFEAFGTRRIVVRTLDAGADKPLKFADLGPEENPALGRRGIRLGMIRTDVLDTQLEALAAAYKATGADVRVMAPMIATQAEATWFAEKVRALGLPKVGVMIEVPAAAIRSRGILYHVDFASLGTNDLQQYTMAADRMQGELAKPAQPVGAGAARRGRAGLRGRSGDGQADRRLWRGRRRPGPRPGAGRPRRVQPLDGSRQGARRPHGPRPAHPVAVPADGSGGKGRQRQPPRRRPQC